MYIFISIYIYLYLCIYLFPYIYIYISPSIYISISIYIDVPHMHMYIYRRKFRSETSDNMHSWKSRGGKSHRRKEVRRSEKKEDAGARTGRKVAIHCVFPMICGSEGRKVTSLKRWVRSQLAKWEIKNCMPLWREAKFQVKMYKTCRSRTTFGSWDVEKVQREAHFQVKMYKAHQRRTTFGSCDVEKVHALWHEAHFQVKSVKHCGVRTTLGRSDIEKMDTDLLN